MHLVQWIAVAVYAGVTLAGVWVAWVNRTGFASVTKEKALVVPDAGPSGLPTEPPNSFSRVVGLVGVMFLSTFIWCYGLFLLTGFNPAGHSLDTLAAKGVVSTNSAASKIFSDEVQNFIVAAAGLFAPYAANQLASALAALRGGVPSQPGGLAGGNVSVNATTVAQLPTTPPPSW